MIGSEVDSNQYKLIKTPGTIIDCLERLLQAYDQKSRKAINTNLPGRLVRWKLQRNQRRVVKRRFINSLGNLAVNLRILLARHRVKVPEYR